MQEKLTKIQLKIILKMQQDWELGLSFGKHRSHWIQQGGVGTGGKIQRISQITFDFLRLNKFIQTKGLNHSIEKFGLSEKGKLII